MNLEPRFLLASASPRRRELLSLTGLDFDMLSIDIDEGSRAGELPDAYVRRLAEEKCLSAAKKNSYPFVLGADTTVADGNELLGKPQTPQQAVQMLQRLRGHAHQVFTAVAFWNKEKHSLDVRLCKTNVPMRNYSDEEIAAYVASGDPMDKAGAYAIQNSGFHPVEDFRGCFANVMGLPLCHLVHMLAQHGIQTNRNVPLRCQETLHFNCVISPAVLRGETIG